jgi:tRNA(Ile)-lysidine synthase TilS/MesJ
MRGDIARLGRCTQISTAGEDTIRRSKPFKYAYEKEIVMYAYFKKLDYFSTECIYSPDAYRGHARAYLKDLEAIRPSVIIDIIYSGEALQVQEDIKIKPQRKFGLSSLFVNYSQGLSRHLSAMRLYFQQRNMQGLYSFGRIRAGHCWRKSCELLSVCTNPQSNNMHEI